MKAYKTVNYTVWEKDGLWYRASSNKKTYWKAPAYESKAEATEGVLIFMLNEAQDRLTDITGQLEKFGWDNYETGDKSIADLLA